MTTVKWAGLLLILSACGARPLIVEGKKNVVLDGLRVPSITVRGSARVTVKNCVLGPTDGVALRIENVAQATLEGNVVHHSAGGIEISGGEAVRIDHNVVAMPAGAGSGILLRDTGKVFLRHNVLVHGDGAGLELETLGALDSDHNVLERVKLGGVLLTLPEWQARGPDAHSTVPSDDVRASTRQYGR